MTPTPRTDAIAHRGLGSVAYIAEMTSFARQLERELFACREWSSKLADVADDLRADLATERALADRLQKSAQAVVDRWETPFWKDAPHTGKFIRSLDDALAAWKESRSGTV